jgi:glycolate oxidase FAD binding subunit
MADQAINTHANGYPVSRIDGARRTFDVAAGRDHFAGIVSADQVSFTETTITVFPANTQQVSEVLRYANEKAITVAPAGGGSKQLWGGPIKADVRLDLSRLNRVLEHPWQDLTCTVQAGCTWQQLQLTLAKYGQFVALDPLWPGRATVGGILATNDSGALRHRYGSLRDLVIGMTLVLADGTIARSGGRVVKNVAGYDLCKLVTGSFGTLAVITEATFRLHPLPQHSETFTVSSSQAATLAPLMQAIRGSQLLTQAVQLRGGPNGFDLDIQLNAQPEAKQSEALKEMTNSYGLVLREGSNGAWQTREELFLEDEAFTLKLTMLPTAVPEVAEYVCRCGGTIVIQSLGLAYAELPAPDHSSVMQVEALRDLLEKSGGSLTLLKEPRSLVYDLCAVSSKPSTLALMRATKNKFDASRTLNPGRLEAL